MEAIMRFSRDAMRQVTVVLLGALFALGLFEVWNLDLRWFVVLVTAIVLVAIAMCFASAFSDFVLISFFFALPFASFDKWFWTTQGANERGSLVYGGVFGLGLLDFVLVGLYLSWFYRVFIIRIQPIPRLCFLDLIAAAFILVYLLSTIGAADVGLALGSTEYLLKHMLLYFYVSRNLRRRHLPWLIAAFCWAIVIEAGFGAYQHWTGKLLGFALDKGQGGAVLSSQYKVPGIELVNRATGTSYDSHAFGNYIGMLLPFPLVLFLTPWIKAGLRALFGIVTLLGILAIALSYSRSAWLGNGIAITIGFILIVAVWQEGSAIVVAAIGAFLLLVTAPYTIKQVYDRFENSPIGTLTTRFDQYKVAVSIWKRFPFFGTGPNNYIEALKKYDYLWLERWPVHNVVLATLAESGIFGLLCYLGIIVSTLKRLFRVVRARRDLPGRLAMASLIAIISYFFDGATDPLYREPNVFAMLWLLIALAVAFERFGLEEAANRSEQPPGLSQAA
jgi:putative inorganic carbon (hco3(-)) transporter